MTCARWLAIAVLLAGPVLADPGTAQTVLRRPTAAEPETLDPMKTTSSDDLTIDMDLFQPLVGRDADQKLIPGAAQSWEASGDGLTYTFHLRPDGRWSNGDPVTADDFVYALRRAVLPQTAAADIGPISRIVEAAAINAGRETDAAKLGVEAPDPATLSIHLTEPQVTLPLELSDRFGMPVHRASFEKSGEAWTRPGNLVGNGPYRLDGWVPNSELVLVRNRYFPNPAGIDFDQVRYVVSDNAETSFKRYLSGEMDWATVPALKLPWARGTHAAELHSGQILGLGFLFFNLKKGLFADHPKLREALSLALDRETLVDKVDARGERPAYGWVSRVIPGYRPPLYPWRDLKMAARIEQARALLADEGYGPGHPLTLTISYPTRDESRKSLLAIAAMWKTALGVEVKLSNQEWRVFIAGMEQWDFEIGLLGRNSEILDPGILLEPFLGNAGENSDTGYANPAFDALVAEGERAPDAAMRFDLLARAEAMMLADYPVIPLSYAAINRLVSPRLRDWRDDEAYPQSRYVRLVPATR
ncbi:MAG TPA: peptide ABC transporter substrate-binding protein [Aliidongia sp.]|uniref:peptide ABC transporter substrate-binding protein n=1 Tax=Aliidongia sp. TaxID=1914230 RepID=UPI002DDCE9BF|nr:peptide ABC transporter substrate-binding protein [Aliidongia sp.]HEV2673636.1 peptide ABC transporter substrate-binding protein [Aliidongia sp.]